VLSEDFTNFLKDKINFFKFYFTSFDLLFLASNGCCDSSGGAVPKPQIFF
jgi:hypothetical protein